MQAQVREKGFAAATSVLAAILLTSMKIVIGLLTGSLGILAEAAHSGLDLVAALITLFAVRVSDRPADESHPYGHGKVENLSALAETLLLLLTCAWIIYEAIDRLFFSFKAVDPSFWAFFTMGTSIVIDFSRSRVLARAAKKYHSQALEADALHFSTDIWSSSVVILGLTCVSLSGWFPRWGGLRYADAVAAIIVAIIVIQVSAKLGWRSVNALLDAAPAGLEEKIVAAAEAAPGVRNCHNVRVRASGSHVFIDIHVLVDGNQTLRAAHELTEQIERAIQEVAPDADVTVHPEPE